MILLLSFFSFRSLPGEKHQSDAYKEWEKSRPPNYRLINKFFLSRLLFFSSFQERRITFCYCLVAICCTYIFDSLYIFCSLFRCVLRIYSIWRMPSSRCQVLILKANNNNHYLFKFSTSAWIMLLSSRIYIAISTACHHANEINYFWGNNHYAPLDYNSNLVNWNGNISVECWFVMLLVAMSDTGLKYKAFGIKKKKTKID